MVYSVTVCPLYSGHLSGMSFRGDHGQATLPPLCLHWQHQVYPPGMVRSMTKFYNTNVYDSIISPIFPSSYLICQQFHSVNLFAFTDVVK